MPFNCPVCLDALDVDIPAPENAANSKFVLVATRCGHIMHRQCLEGWLSRSKGSKGCPKCKKKMNPKNLTYIFPNIGTEDNNNVDAENLPPKKSKGNRSRNSEPKLPPPKNLPVSKCGNQQCQDNLPLYSSLVNDYNSLLEKCLAQDKEISKINRECDTINLVSNDIQQKSEKIQTTRISMLLKRSGCKCEDRAPATEILKEKMSEDSDVETLDDESDEDAEVRRINAVLAAEDEEHMNVDKSDPDTSDDGIEILYEHLGQN